MRTGRGAPPAVGAVGPDRGPEDGSGWLRGCFGEMARIRAFEDAVAEAHQTQGLPGLLHLSIGGEAVAVGVNACLGEGDLLFTGHRPHGHFLAAGVDPYQVMAELAGRESGLCRGRGGTMHLMSSRVVMATGVVGGTLPIAVGASLRQPPGRIVVVFFGDGAAQTGYFHESMNLASLWTTPVLFVCENNGWAEFSARSEHTRVGGVERYGALYRMEARSVDGTDVEVVAAATRDLVGRIRGGGGPALLECHISRLRAHYEGDPRKATSSGDPMAVVEQRLAAGGVPETELRAVREAAADDARRLLASVMLDDPAQPAADPHLVFARPR